ncbi:MAG: amidohydrolase family protein [bacterium]|nr:amidohydrolase [Deltaproteobacteria bacterium]MCP4908197.1 amidohydrolase family protein [bacterium]
MSSIVIRGGTVLDGTGAPGVEADLLVKDGRVAAIGSGLSGDRELDASGAIVAPGFIDIHTHYDAQVFWDPALTPSCFHGVTTVVAGNCGFSLAPTREGDRENLALTLEKVEDMDPASLMEGIPWDFETFPEYLASVEKRGTLLNYTAYIGHTALRLYHLGAEAAYGRAATEAEVAAMSQSVREAMEAGAVGLATSFAPTHVGIGGKPVCSRVGDFSEFETMAGELTKLGRGVVGTTLGGNFTYDEVYAFQRRIGVPLTYTALLAIPGLWQHAVDVHHRELEKGGSQVWPQISVRKITLQNQLKAPFVFDSADCFAALYAEAPEKRWERYRDVEWRKRAIEELKDTPLPTRWENFELAESEIHTDLIDRSLVEIAKDRGEHPFDAMVALSLEENLETRFRYIQANDDEDGIAHLLQQEQMAMGLSDAGAHVGMLCDAPLPTDLLGNWVREREVIPIEKAVHKLTGEPAGIFRFEDRGVLREGAHADVCVFDPKEVGPGKVRRVRDFPANSDRLTADSPSGIRHVLVNGVAISENGESLPSALEERPGQHPTQLGHA